MPGTYGKGYDGVRSGASPPEYAVPRTVRCDSVDSVETVDVVRVDPYGAWTWSLPAPTGGDGVSSLMGDTRFTPMTAALMPWPPRNRFCCCSLTFKASRSFARSSSGEVWDGFHP